MEEFDPADYEIRAALHASTFPMMVVGGVGVLAILAATFSLLMALARGGQLMMALPLVLLVGWAIPLLMLVYAATIGNDLKQARMMVWFWRIALVYSLGMGILQLGALTVGMLAFLG